MQGLWIREAVAEDIPVVDRLLARSYPKLLRGHYPPSIQVLAIPIIAKAQPGLVTCGTYYVAEREGEIVGCGGWTRHGPQGEGEAHVRHVATDPDAVRSGVGRAILAQIAAKAKRAGVHDLHCLSTLNACAFYLRMGFEKIGPRAITLRPGIVFEAVAMRCALPR